MEGMAETVDPCPFCGGETLGIIGASRNPALCRVECLECGTLGPRTDSPSAAVAKWNERSKDEKEEDDDEANPILCVEPGI